MAIVKEGIILENDNTLSFGDYIRADKLKVEDFKVNDDTYKVRKLHAFQKTAHLYLKQFQVQLFITSK